MLTVKQAAARACVSAGLVRGWIGAGQLAHSRVGGLGRRGKILIAEADLDALLATFKVGTREPGRVAAPPAGQVPPPAALLSSSRRKSFA